MDGSKVSCCMLQNEPHREEEKRDRDSYAVPGGVLPSFGSRTRVGSQKKPSRSVRRGGGRGREACRVGGWEWKYSEQGQRRKLESLSQPDEKFQSSLSRDKIKGSACRERREEGGTKRR